MKNIAKIFFFLMIYSTSNGMYLLKSFLNIFDRKPPYEPKLIHELRNKRKKLDKDMKGLTQWKVETDEKIESINDKFIYCRFDGYSMIGALLVRKSRTTFHANQFFKVDSISELLKMGAKPTEKDQWLVYLDLYERTRDVSMRKLMLLLLNTYSGLPKLPPEIIQYIGSYITHNEEPLIPRYLCTECKMIKK